MTRYRVQTTRYSNSGAEPRVVSEVYTSITDAEYPEQAEAKIRAQEDPDADIEVKVVEVLGGGGPGNRPKRGRKRWTKDG